ncbi:hypothetical protein HAHI6034_03150 [Hathewaya histolytica]|uniref:Lipoprotein n=1 Tax=Hathewaya histolytica TaxID=1498 RepID=A0A4U9R242_HATHI|nr:hypothetical protein [Hathewaya histolytica]VTQ85235.1 Uncharacterised protein [Hathewaya histolytica]
MERLLSLLLISIMAFSFTGCAGYENTKEEKSQGQSKQEVVKEDNKESNVKMPKKEMGKGKIEISTAGGTSGGGKIPVEFIGKDAQISQIGLNSEEFDGAKLSYIFIDGKEVEKEQLGNTQTAINLKGNALKEGKHKVEVVQFDNDKTDGKIITYKTASYESKLK